MASMWMCVATLTMTGIVVVVVIAGVCVAAGLGPTSTAVRLAQMCINIRCS